MSFTLTKIATLIVLPPLNFLLLAAIGFAFTRRSRRLGLGLIGAALVGLYIVATPYCAGWLLRAAAPNDALPSVSALTSASAIVVLGAGTYFGAPEYGVDTAGPATLERLRYAARLHRQTALPVLVSGGAPYGNATSEALQMRAVLAEDFDTPVKWLEERAADTFQSAFLARGILEAERIDRIVLVTHAAHMRRARFAFERAGFEVIAAATGYTTAGPRTAVAFLPSAEGLMMGHTFFHEMIGLGWYHLRFASRQPLGVVR